jgi:hypothetical protein
MTTSKRLLLLIPFVLFLVPSAANAAPAPAPGWSLDTIAQPTSFSAGDSSACQVSDFEIGACDSFQVTATDAGARAAEGVVAPIVITDEVPGPLVVTGGDANLELRGIEPSSNQGHLPVTEEGVGSCSVTGQLARCEYTGTVQPDEKLLMIVKVTVPPGTPAGSLPASTAEVSGGGAAPVTQQVASSVDGSPPFGLSNFEFFASNPNGTRDSQAGDHPYELTTTIDLNSDIRVGSAGQVESTSVEDVKDIVVDLPVGFVGSILAAPQCSFSQLTTTHECPADTRIGSLITFPQTSGAVVNSYIFNMTPQHGEAAEFGYTDTLHSPHFLFAHVVPTAKGYVLQTTSNEIPQIELSKIIATFYGDPSKKNSELGHLQAETEIEHKAAEAEPEPLHRKELEEKGVLPLPPEGSTNAQIPFFTNPTDCAGEEPTATIYIDSWQRPAQVNPDGVPVNLEEQREGKPLWVKDEAKAPPVSGCNALVFAPELGAQPTTHESDKPSGMEFELKVPQTESNGVLGTPTLKQATVTLPEGYTVDPSAGDGLAACSIAQIGWQGTTLPNGAELPKIHGPHGEEPNPGYTNFNESPPACPEASKIGSLELESPLVPHPLTGELFLAAQNENPYHSTLAAYVVVHDPITGVLIKIPGEFLPDPSTGRLTAIFGENPNLPFSDLKLHFFGGPRAELATPESCGTFTTGSILEPWSAPDSGSASPFDSFFIDEACPAGFAPSFAALSTNVQAGAYTPLQVSFQRSDTDQELAGLTVTLPPGLLADVGSVPQCGEAQANAGTCPEASQVGTVVTSVGPGPNPLQVAGKAYLTGPYNGGPYGLSVVVPAVAGPYNFGTVVVRQSIRIDPTTAQVTDVSDPFPTIIDGIPLRLRRVDVTLNRPGFTFNPTSCAKLGFNGSISGSPLGGPRRLNGTVGYATQAGATAPFAAPFQVTNCASLKFQPKFSVSTTGHTSKALGASLTAKLSYPKTAQGTEANIARVKVDLPKQLPSQLKTLQKACTSAQFNLNPANCPKESKIGFATVSTPILALPLSGPAIFVSHGNEAFPSLTMVLQGDGVTIDLVGSTLIKNGITSTTFKTVPDTPFSTFELKLPQGKFAALNTNLPEKDHGNLCGQNLKMPTEFVAQNGAKINESTKISVTGCKKVVKKKKKHAKAKTKQGGHR